MGGAFLQLYSMTTKLKDINTHLDDYLAVVSPSKKWNSAIGMQIATDDKNRHFISKIDKDSPASMAGMRLESQILRINGIKVENEEHELVCRLINTFKGDRINFLLRNTYESDNVENYSRRSNISHEYKIESGLTFANSFEYAEMIVDQNLRELNAAILTHSPIECAGYRFDGSLEQRLNSLKSLDKC